MEDYGERRRRVRPALISTRVVPFCSRGTPLGRPNGIAISLGSPGERYFLRLNAQTSDDRLPMTVAKASSSGGSNTNMRISRKRNCVLVLFRVGQDLCASPICGGALAWIGSAVTVERPPAAEDVGLRAWLG